MHEEASQGKGARDTKAVVEDGRTQELAHGTALQN